MNIKNCEYKTLRNLNLEIAGNKLARFTSWLILFPDVLDRWLNSTTKFEKLGPYAVLSF
jgi:hypothetical protein